MGGAGAGVRAGVLSGALAGRGGLSIFPLEAKPIADEVLRVLKSGGHIDIDTRGRPEWAATVRLLFEASQFSAGEAVVRAMLAAHPDAPFFQRAAALLQAMPPAPPPGTFEVSRRPGAVICRRAAASVTLVCFFGGGEVGTGVPGGMLHRWLSHLDAHLVYVRSPPGRRELYLSGVPGLGADLDSTLAELGRLHEGFGADGLVCYGSSSGGFGAMLYGLKLGAEAVIGLGAVTNMRPEFNTHLALSGISLQAAAANPDAELDLRPGWAAAQAPPRLLLAFGEYYWDDRIYAEHMQDLPGVRLHEVPGVDNHNVAFELMVRGEYLPLLGRFIAEAT